MLKVRAALADHYAVAGFRRRRFRAGAVALAAIVAALALLVPPGAEAVAPIPQVPQPNLQLPPEVDSIASYEGQTICDPTPKPGALALRSELLSSYGQPSGVWAGISRDCDVSWDRGVSEHKDGRAIDWGLPPAYRWWGHDFVNWATANNGANARRMGIMYIIWDNRMWRNYPGSSAKPLHTWTEYGGCFSKPASSYDTTCHRDHVHISMTWHGAGADTSWYDGSAVTLPGCSVGSVSGNPGSMGSPSVLLDPTRGIGTGGKGCYLDSSIRTVQVSAAGSATQRLRITGLKLNAPTQLRVWTEADGSLVTVSNGQSPTLNLPITSSGKIFFQVPVGQGQLRVEGLGGESRARLQAFVAQAYRDVLGREPDDPGLQGWTDALASGRVSASQFAESIVYSYEASMNAAAQLYRGTLGRNPDRAGQEGWAEALGSRQASLKNVRALFWASEERYGQSGSNDTQWVRDLYVGELRRQPDQSGLSGWVAATPGLGRPAVAQAFVDCDECATKEVTRAYWEFLKRAPDPGGLANWVRTYPTSDYLALAVSFVSSAEYYNRATAGIK